MARLARVVVPGKPHHVIQRGNRRQKVFFNDQDKVEYLKILGLQSNWFGLKIWAYCLMNNHVHLIVVPDSKESLVNAIGETHALYTRMINFREGWRGYLWQGRFKSAVMDEQHLYAAIRYVERNPVRAGLVANPEDYDWSSAKAHVLNKSDELLTRCYLQDTIVNWKEYLATSENEKVMDVIRRNSQSGRPIGDSAFVQELETLTGRVLVKQQPGPKR